MIVPDILAPGLDLVFCGTAPSRASREARAYYAHPGNIFWRTVFEVGLTPRRMAPAEGSEILRYGLGLTDLNKTEWGADSELSAAGFDIAGFVTRMRATRPGAIAFTSKQAASRYFAGCGAGTGRRPVAYGRQADTLDGIALFVLPSPSGRARMFFDIEPWRELAVSIRR